MKINAKATLIYFPSIPPRASIDICICVQISCRIICFFLWSQTDQVYLPVWRPADHFPDLKATHRSAVISPWSNLGPSQKITFTLVHEGNTIKKKPHMKQPIAHKYSHFCTVRLLSQSPKRVKTEKKNWPGLRLVPFFVKLPHESPQKIWKSGNEGILS